MLSITTFRIFLFVPSGQNLELTTNARFPPSMNLCPLSGTGKNILSGRHSIPGYYVIVNIHSGDH